MEAGPGKDYVKGRKQAWEKHVRKSDLGMMPCNHITEAMARQFILTLDILGRDQKTKLLQTFRRLSKLAIKRGSIRYCPFADLKLPKKRSTEDKIKFWHPEEEYPLLLQHACSDEAREVFGFMMGSGARPAEAKNFRWDDIDMNPENPRLTFRHGGSEDGATKSGKVATVPMLPEARTWLQHRIDRLHNGIKPEEGLVFPSSKTGEAYSRTHVFRLDDSIEAAGIRKKGRRRYAFRHGFCVALANGFFGEHWSRAEARELMRQDGEEVIDEHYRVLTPRLASKAAKAKGLTILGGAEETPGDVTSRQSSASHIGKVALYH